MDTTTAAVRRELLRHRSTDPGTDRAEVATALRFACAPTLAASRQASSRSLLEAEVACDHAARRLAGLIGDLFDVRASRPSSSGTVPAAGTRHLLRFHAPADDLARRMRLCDSAGRWVRGLPPPVVAGRSDVLAAAWRAAFLAGGSLGAGPRSGMEVVCPTSETVIALIGAARRLGVTATAAPLQDRERVVVRDADDVRTLLGLMGAPSAARTWRPSRRTPACSPSAAFDVANQERAALAAAATTAQVRELLAALPPATPTSLVAVGLLRVRHPEASLHELGKLADPPMSKDAVAGRLRRLLGYAQRLDSVG